MLVLSRRTSEKILLPSMNVCVQVVAIRPGQVRLGIEAPPEVQVLRAEIAHQYASPRAPSLSVAVGTAASAPLSPINAARTSMALLRRQLEAGLMEEACATLDRLNKEFAALQEEEEADQGQVQVEVTAVESTAPAPKPDEPCCCTRGLIQIAKKTRARHSKQNAWPVCFRHLVTATRQRAHVRRGCTSADRCRSGMSATGRCL